MHFQARRVVIGLILGGMVDERKKPRSKIKYAHTKNIEEKKSINRVFQYARCVHCTYFVMVNVSLMSS